MIVILTFGPILRSQFFNFGGIDISSNELQPWKQKHPIDVTDGGIATFLIDPHPLKEQLPICVTEEGISIVFNEEHPLKILLSITFIDEGFSNSISTKELHL